ncbi:MAG: SURF1 family protein [Rhodocyclaceae bacterium]|nr:SURF1 family protein [Rhodocyclaceae bacterium]
MRWGRLVPFGVGVVLAVTGFELGQWQLRRADEKTALQAHFDRMAARPAAPLPATEVPEAWQPVVLHGDWLEGADFLIDNRVHAGRPGYHVVSALRLDDGRVVLVNRGWTPLGQDRSQLPDVSPPTGPLEVRGVVRMPEADPFRLAQPEAGIVRQHLVPDEIGALIGRAVAPWIVLQSPQQGEPLVRDWQRPDAGIDRHKGYAVQWFGLATLVASLTAFFGWREFSRGEQA